MSLLGFLAKLLKRMNTSGPRPEPSYLTANQAADALATIVMARAMGHSTPVGEHLVIELLEARRWGTSPLAYAALRCRTTEHDLLLCAKQAFEDASLDLTRFCYGPELRFEDHMHVIVNIGKKPRNRVA